MTTFKLVMLLLTAAWFLLVMRRFRRSSMVLIGGLCGIGLVILLGLVLGKIAPAELGLGPARSWLAALGLALAGLALMLAYSPLADRLAARWFANPPILEAFRPIQQSRAKLIAGIAAAWVLGGFLEELVARGIVLNSIHALLSPALSEPVAAGIAICLAALGAGLVHQYQGPRAAAIVTQLSVLLGVLFVLSGYNLWAVIICHGLYDTIAFVRFAAGKSRYARLDRDGSGRTSQREE